MSYLLLISLLHCEIIRVEGTDEYNVHGPTCEFDVHVDWVLDCAYSWPREVDRS